MVTGGPGRGKSALAATLAQILIDDPDSPPPPFSSFFCRKKVSDREDPRRIFPTLLWQLCDDPLWRLRIESVLEKLTGAKKATNISGASPSHQIDLLIRALAQTLVIRRGPKPIFLIDALDECVDGKDGIVKALQEKRQLLCSLFTVVIFTRRTEPIQNAGLFTPLGLLDLDDDAVHLESTSQDISMFLRLRLREVQRNHEAPEDWPSVSEVAQLVDKARGYFIWAAVVVEFVDNEIEWEEAWQKVLHGDFAKGSELDELYREVLQRALSKGGALQTGWVEEYRRIMGAILCTVTDCSPSTIGQLIGKETKKVEDWLKRIRPLISFGQDGKVRVLHASIDDYLRSDGAASFMIDSARTDAGLARRCLVICNQRLTFNLGKIEDPSTPFVPSVRINDDALEYAVLHWSTHFVRCGSVHREDLDDVTGSFFGAGVLNWMEACCLAASIYHSIKALADVKSLPEVCTSSLPLHRQAKLN